MYIYSNNVKKSLSSIASMASFFGKNSSKRACYYRHFYQKIGSYLLAITSTSSRCLSIKIFCLIACLSSSSLVIADESYGDLSARIDDLEKKVSGQSPGGAEFATKDDIESLTNQIRELRGRIEVLEHSASKSIIQSNASSAGDLIETDKTGESLGSTDDNDDDVDAILKDLGSSASPKEIARETATKKAEKEAPTGSLEKSNESAQYDQAMALFKKKEYAEAEEAFRYYVAQYPKGKQVSQAKLHIAESQLGTAMETKEKSAAKSASADFAAAYKANPKGSNGAKALLGMAQSIKLQGETKKACVVLKKLKADFPQEKNTMKKAQELSKQYKCS